MSVPNGGSRETKREVKTLKRERHSRQQEGKGRTEKGISIFVENIPQNLDQYGLKGIFQKVGRVSDTYIPFKRGTENKRRFAFARFWRK